MWAQPLLAPDPLYIVQHRTLIGTDNDFLWAPCMTTNASPKLRGLSFASKKLFDNHNSFRTRALVLTRLRYRSLRRTYRQD